jgi:uncharacterized protein with HEPN domain
VKDDSVYLRHVMDAIRRIEDYCTDGKEAFLTTPMIQDAVIRNLEIIGEAAGKISPSLRAAYPSIAWRQLAGLRNVLIHNYMGVDLERVWDVVEKRLVDLANGITAILGENWKA